MPYNGKVRDDTNPYSVLVALEEGSSVYVKDVKVPLPCGCALIFRGDVVHSGSEYKYDNIRFHMYMDVVGSEHIAGKGKSIQWV